MLDGVSLDQLRTFIAAADTGSFSAAGRRLSRAQSVVSQTIASLEAQFGVPLFDRAGRYPRLTEQGPSDAGRCPCGRRRHRRAQGARERHGRGWSPNSSVVVDVMFPMVVLTHAVAAFGVGVSRHAAAPLCRGAGRCRARCWTGTASLGVSARCRYETAELVSERLIGVTW